ncbi:adenine phosphoribosyltransferase [Cerasicoccus arenae]|uniref:Adenine phosphoribosyltransferase n=1 Tax=Cerasicoccus arenae TaxID=424488 RepID=A0A8J3DEL9_9BACT|nr:adenine phosphoribosyltransferase [Cerasicoccus arenae]MBK1858329.1 adenine phosphoribosyltransferase [Cerasicoccus arenae]GHB90810.1 adenine phosphoribosyltransferase [Cerasicoccus arenae]
MKAERIKASIRTIRGWPHEGINFRDVTTLFEDPAAFRSVLNRIAGWAEEEEFDIVVGIDARGFILAGALAYQQHLPLVLVRKKGKLPFTTISEDYELEYGSATVETHDSPIIEGKRVLIVDDLLATGGTALAAARLIRRLGARAVSFAAIIDLVELPGREALTKSGIDVYTVIDFTEAE